MWILLPALCLAMSNIAGDNIGLAPDLAGFLQSDMYLITIIAYLLVGPIIGGITAWIGMESGEDLLTLTKRLYGSRGKKILGIVILGVCLPASALTGGYYAGKLLGVMTGLPEVISIFLSLVIFSLAAAGYGGEILKLCNYIALLFIPLLILLLLIHGFSWNIVKVHSSSIEWLLVLALVGYNVQGMSAVLIVEMAACLAVKGYKVIGLVFLAKIIEAVLTLLMVYLVIAAGASGPLALSQVVQKIGGGKVLQIFNFVAFCTLFSTMAPAMLVNVRQVSYISGWTFWPSLCAAVILIFAISFSSFHMIVMAMGYTSAVMIVFIIYTAFLLHKNKQH